MVITVMAMAMVTVIFIAMVLVTVTVMGMGLMLANILRKERMGILICRARRSSRESGVVSQESNDLTVISNPC